MKSSSDSQSAPTPYQRPHFDQLRQVWPIDPAARARIIESLTRQSQREATLKTKNKDGQTIERKFKPREALQAMRLLKRFGSLALEQQRLDREAHGHVNRSRTLNDFVTPVVELAGDRLHEEAMRRGLDCAAELDPETRDAICDQAERDWVAKHGPVPQYGPKPLVEFAPEQRNDWVIPAEAQAQIMARLVDMVDPQGDEYHELRPRERVMAGKVLTSFCGLVQEQQRLDREEEAAGPIFDWEKWVEEIDADRPRLLAERKQRRAEWRQRQEAEGLKLAQE